MIATESNPSTQANEVRRSIVRGMRDGALTLYEAYLLHCEALRIDRIAYTQSAWGRQLSISGLLSIVMHSITAEAFGLHDAASTYERWYVDDFSQLGERRPHFLTAAYPGTTGWRNDLNFLRRLNITRIEYDRLSDNDGPYPIEVFPFHFAAPELALIGEPVDAFLNAKRDVSDAVGDAIVELATGRWG
tara:strand:- start:390 stop:956 length:567 start_codon:yes stop_codon:yes gene_type:complete